MQMDVIETLYDGRHALGECPLWCERSGRLYWTDIAASKLWSCAPDSGVTLSWPIPERLASFALTNDDDVLLLGLASRLARFNLASGVIQTICEVEPELPSTRINDGRCDRNGGFVFGTLNEAPDCAPIGSFYRLSPNFSLSRLSLPNIAIANSICFSPDGRTMYYCDSLTKTLRCCDYDGTTGVIKADRQFADLRDESGVPDGSCIDADGYLWNTVWGGRRIVRYAPDGTLDRIIPVPVAQPSCVNFGGPQLDTLFFTSARVSMTHDALAAEPTAGGVFRTRLENVFGIAESRFGGSA